MTPTTQVNLQNIDAEFTQNWQTLCIGRYSLKVPPELLQGEVTHSMHYDGYKLEVIPNQSQADFDTLVKQTQAKIRTLPAPEGLEAALHREEVPGKNQYLVAYRSGIDKEMPFLSTPEVLSIKGYVLIENKILYAEASALDGYKNVFEGDKDEQGNTINWDMEFKKQYFLGQRILGLAEPAILNRSGTLKPGFCVGNAVLIAGNPVTEQLAKYKAYNRNRGYSFTVRVDYIGRLHEKKLLSDDKEYDLQTNGLGGSVHSRVDQGYAEYKWFYESWQKGVLDHPYIQINFDEELDHPRHGDIAFFDKAFLNLMASFHLRE